MASTSSAPAAAPQTATGAAGHLGERRLTTLHAIGQTLAIGPIFSAGALLGLVAGVAGFNTPLSVLLGGIGALGLAYVISLYARRFSGAGAIYEYLTHGAHPSVGVFCAGLYFVGMLFLGGGGVFIAIGFLTEGFFTAHWSAIGVDWWIWGAIGLLITVGLNHWGVRIAIEGVLTLAFLSAVPFLILAVAIIAKGGADTNTLSVFDPGQTSLNDVFNGILFAVTLFIGFEIAASIGEETRDPKRSIPIAVMGSVAIVSIFYLLVSYAGTIGFGVKDIAKWPADPSPMGTLANQYVGNWLSVIVDLVIPLDALSVAIAFTVGASRGFFALGRDGLLPRALATTSRHDTPLGGNVVILVSGILFLIFGAVTSYGDAVKLPNEIEAFTISAATGSYLIELIYVILAVVALRLVWQLPDRSKLWWRVPLVLIGLATPVLAYKGSLDPWPKYPANRGIIFALVAFGVVAVWFAYLRLRHPDRIAVAAAHAAEHEGVPPLDETLQFQPAAEPGLGEATPRDVDPPRSDHD
jgi:amino acid transporter